MRLIDGNALYEKASDLEAQALDYTVKISNDEEKREEWLRWSAILAERTAFKHDVYDAPTIDPEPHWIPCSERLPGHEYTDKCILISMAGETIVARALDGINYGRGVWEFDNYSEAMGREAEFYPWNKIDAWMPLPAPYKEDTE